MYLIPKPACTLLHLLTVECAFSASGVIQGTVNQVMGTLELRLLHSAHGGALLQSLQKVFPGSFYEQQ